MSEANTEARKPSRLRHDDPVIDEILSGSKVREAYDKYPLLQERLVRAAKGLKNKESIPNATASLRKLIPTLKADKLPVFVSYKAEHKANARCRGP